jgi:hypothetical protein
MFTEQGHTKHISPVNGDMFFRAAHAAPGGAHDILLPNLQTSRAYGARNTKRRAKSTTAIPRLRDRGFPDQKKSVTTGSPLR